MNKSVTSGQATVKRDLVVAPGRQGEAVCPLNALLQSQQPHPNSLSLVCRRLLKACRTTSSSILAMLEAESPLCTLVSLIHLTVWMFVNQQSQIASLKIYDKMCHFFKEVKFKKLHLKKGSCSTDMDFKRCKTDVEVYCCVSLRRF